jgi:histidine ammonia-lyase
MSKSKEKIILNGGGLTLEDFILVTREDVPVEIHAQAIERVAAARTIVEDMIAAGRPMYGINTGFGRFSDVAVPESDLNLLQINLIRADAVGVGPVLPRDATRGMLLLRLNSLLKGLSGVRPLIVETLASMLNKRVHPLIPEKGSVGSSGDLCPLAHMTLPMIGEGEAMEGARAMKKAGIPLVDLRAKEGLSLINGTQCMTSVGAHALWGAMNLLKASDIIGALTTESLRGVIDAFDPRIHEARMQPGQIDAAANLRDLLSESDCVTRQGELRMQDAYSIRCMPQVHGASRMAVLYVKNVVEAELNAVTDNPLVLPDTREVFSGGNFHGQPVSVAMDALGIAVSELGNISERRAAKLVDPALNHGLPAFLVKHGGLNCGFMVPQYAAAALVSENKILAHPASVDSIPTSAGQEDHVSMGTIAARKAAAIVSHVESILGIEWMCAAQAVDLQFQSQGARKLGKGTSPAHELLRRHVAFMENDRIFYKDQDKAANLIRKGELVKAVEEKTGRLR